MFENTVFQTIFIKNEIKWRNVWIYYISYKFIVLDSFQTVWHIICSNI